MGRRVLKPAIELASALGVRAHDLCEGYTNDQAVAAIVFLWSVNPDLFRWLHDRLVEASKEVSK